VNSVRMPLECLNYAWLAFNEGFFQQHNRTKESLPNVRHHYYRGLQALRKFLQSQPSSEVQPRKLNREGNDVES